MGTVSPRVLALALTLAACGGNAKAKDPEVDGQVGCATESDCTAPTPYCDPDTRTCVACRFDTHCTGAERICEAQQCRTATTCKELVSHLPGLASGIYTIDPDGAGGADPFDAWCDMTLDGGGWMALINPDGMGLPATDPALTSSTTVLSGAQSCGASTVPQPFVANGWNGLRSYACGTVTFRLSLGWANTIGATDVMFLATLQGQNTRTLAVNGAAITATASTLDPLNAVCAFYAEAGKSATPTTNGCWSLTLAAQPHAETAKLDGDLALDITTGAACSPDCSHGTGMNIQKLFVR